MPNKVCHVDGSRFNEPYMATIKVNAYIESTYWCAYYPMKLYVFVATKEIFYIYSSIDMVLT